MIKLGYDYGVPNLAYTVDGTEDDASFATAVLISLLTNRRATENEALDPTNRGGWWGDSYANIEGDQSGSKLWLLSGNKVTESILSKAVEYALEALDWMKQDGITETVEVVATRVSPDVLDLEISIERPDKPADKWLGFWEATLSQT